MIDPEKKSPISAKLGGFALQVDSACWKDFQKALQKAIADTMNFPAKIALGLEKAVMASSIEGVWRERTRQQGKMFEIALQREIHWQLGVICVENALPECMTDNRHRIAELLYLAGECFDRSVLAIAVHHRMKIRP